MNWMVHHSARFSTLALTLLGGVLLSSINLHGEGSPNIIWQAQDSDRINSVVFSPDGGTLIAGSSSRLINFWRVSDGTLTQTLNSGAPKVHENSVEWLAISSDGSRLASCSYRTVKLWRLPGGTEQQLNGHDDWVVSVAFSPGGTYLASASFDGTVKIWRGSDGAFVTTINIGNGEVRAVAFSPNGQYLASAGGDKAVRIWRTSDWSLVQTLTGHTQDIYVLAFSPDGAHLASGGYDQTVRVWNTSTWANRYTINAGGNVYALSFTRDSQQLGLSNGESNNVELHRVSDGALLRRYDQAVDNVQTIAFSSGGTMGYGRADATVVLASTSGSSPTPPPTDPPPTKPPVTNPPPVVVPQGNNPLTIVWQHGSGALSGWAMDGTNRLAVFPINNNRFAGGNWRLLGLGDFNGDSQEDFVWQNANGATALWIMNDHTMSTSSAVKDGNKIDPRWRVIGVGDFNQDGQNDILFQTANGLLRTWLMNGTDVSETATMLDGSRLTAGWHVVGVADFDHDGNSDLVLENNIGVVEIELMNGVEKLQMAPLFNGQPQARGWRVVGTGDFNGDGQTDLLLQHSSNYLAVWFMQGTTFSKAVYLNGGKRATAGWRVVGVTQ